MNFDQALAYLLSLGHETLTIKLGLKNTESLLAALGNPQKDFPAVQIAGTNGKGSTAVMLESICQAAGIRTGLFTSPHLISITERIKVAGKEISKEEFAQLTSAVRNAAQGLVDDGTLQTPPTFFEHVTAIALLAFREANVELAILETGLGGRLDSTTAARAGIVGITPVAMDHEEYLGSTLAEIAGEKAAIIRPGVIAVIAPQPREAFEVIDRRCQETNVRPVWCEIDDASNQVRYPVKHCYGKLTELTADGRCRATFQTLAGVYENVLIGLRGRHQINNAAVAVSLAEAVRDRGFTVSKEAIISGLQSASHAGRLELWSGQPRVLFDGAHNAAAAQTLRAYLSEFVQAPITMVFGAMKDKRLPQMAETLFPIADNLVLTEMENPRAASIDLLLEAAPANYERRQIHTAANVKEAVNIAAKLTPPEGVICVTGSLYLVGAAQSILKDSKQNFALQYL